MMTLKKINNLFSMRNVKEVPKSTDYSLNFYFSFLIFGSIFCFIFYLDLRLYFYMFEPLDLEREKRRLLKKNEEREYSLLTDSDYQLILF